MSKDLAERIRAGRRFTITAGGVEYRCRRPTDFEAISLQQRIEADGAPAICAQFIEGWSLTEMALIGEGDDQHEVSVSPELVTEWLSDHAADAFAILTRLVDEYRKRMDALADAGN